MIINNVDNVNKIGIYSVIPTVQNEYKLPTVNWHRGVPRTEIHHVVGVDATLVVADHARHLHLVTSHSTRESGGICHRLKNNK